MGRGKKGTVSSARRKVQREAGKEALLGSPGVLTLTSGPSAPSVRACSLHLEPLLLSKKPCFILFQPQDGSPLFFLQEKMLFSFLGGVLPLER